MHMPLLETYLPATLHVTQPVTALIPVLVVVLPVGHSIHAADPPALWYLLPAQDVHVVAPAAENLPLAHVLHCELEKYVPALHVLGI